MRTKKNLCGIIISIAWAVTTNAQVSTPFNTGGSGDYVGWDINQAFSLNIVHEAAPLARICNPC